MTGAARTDNGREQRELGNLEYATEPTAAVVKGV